MDGTMEEQGPTRNGKYTLVQVILRFTSVTAVLGGFGQYTPQTIITASKQTKKFAPWGAVVGTPKHSEGEGY